MNVFNEPAQINRCNSAEGHFKEITDATSTRTEISITDRTRNVRQVDYDVAFYSSVMLIEILAKHTQRLFL